MSKVSEPWSACQQRHLAYISEFTTDIQHVAGKSNAVADCLSRASTNVVQLGVNYSSMAVDQCLCEHFHRSMKSALRAALKDDNWYDWLPWVLLGLRMAPKEDLLACSVELVYGQTLKVPGYLVPDIDNPWSSPRNSPTLRSHVSTFIPVPTSQHGLHKV